VKKNLVTVIALVAGCCLVMRASTIGWADSKEEPSGHATTDTGGASTSQEGATTPAPSETGSAPTKEAAEPTHAEPAAPEGAEPTAPVTAEAPGSSPAAPAQDGLISIDFKDADIRQVLRIISLKSGVDVVAGTDVEGLVTIKLTNVPWEQALGIILRTYGFTYSREGKIVRVMTVESLEQEALSTEVFPLDYAKAKDVPDVIKEMLSDRGKVKFDERTNTIIVTDIPANLFQIKEVVGRLDKRTPQVLIETKVVETRLTKDENLGIDWSDSFSLTAASATAPSTFPFPKSTELGSLGHTFLTKAGTGAAGVLTENQFYPSGRGGLIPGGGGTFTFGTLTSSGLQMVMNFLKSRTDTHIVSNPNVTVLNNQEAKIHIGEEYPVPTYTIDPTTGRTSISGYTPKLTGTVLTVTPHVNPSSEVVVDLRPEVIAVGADVQYNLAGTSGSVNFPRFTTQTAKTSVRIQNGQTIAIGGLVKSSEVKVESKVPILGDIPGVGLLFKNTRWYGGGDPVRQDLLIFLTVKLTEENPVAEKTVAAAPTPTPYP